MDRCSLQEDCNNWIRDKPRHVLRKKVLVLSKIKSMPPNNGATRRLIEAAPGKSNRPDPPGKAT